MFPHCPQSTQTTLNSHPQLWATDNEALSQIYLDFFNSGFLWSTGLSLCRSDIFPLSVFISNRCPLIPWYTVQQQVQIYSSP